MLANALSGLKVLDFSQVFAGPTCTLMLADLGADVVKVEPPAGDLGRGLAPWVAGESVPFLAVNRNKRGIVLDLKRPEHLQAAREMAGQADVVVESFRPGVMERLGLGYTALSAINPQLVYCSISAYGQEGSARDLPGVDGVLQAVSGLMSITGEPGSAPCKVTVPVVDVVTGYLASVSILAALVQRQGSGRGQHVESSMFASAIALQHANFAAYFATGQVPGPGGSAAPYSTPNEALCCSDGWIMVAAYHPARWLALCAAIGAPELAADPRFADNESRLAHREELRRQLEHHMAPQPRAHWLAKFTAADIICGPINNYGEVVRAGPFAEQSLAETLKHPRAGELTMPRSVLASVGERPMARGPAPLLGEHTRQILAGFEKEATCPSP